jgi:hypothetical protein
VPRRPGRDLHGLVERARSVRLDSEALYRNDLAVRARDRDLGRLLDPAELEALAPEMDALQAESIDLTTARRLIGLARLRDADLVALLGRRGIATSWAGGRAAASMSACLNLGRILGRERASGGGEGDLFPARVVLPLLRAVMHQEFDDGSGPPRSWTSARTATTSGATGGITTRAGGRPGCCSSAAGTATGSRASPSPGRTSRPIGVGSGRPMRSRWASRPGSPTGRAIRRRGPIPSMSRPAAAVASRSNPPPPPDREEWPMFIRIDNHLVSTASIARATFEGAAEQAGVGREVEEAPQLTLAFVGNHPPAMAIRGDDARRAWADLQPPIVAPRAPGTK